jgi:hypothetical protein
MSHYKDIQQIPLWLRKLLKSRYEAAILAYVVEEWPLKKAAAYYQLYWLDLYIKAKKFQKIKNMHIAIQFDNVSLNSLSMLKRSRRNEQKRIDDIRNEEILQKYEGREDILYKKAIEILIHYMIKQRTIAQFYNISLLTFNWEIIKYKTCAKEAYQFGEPMFSHEKARAFLEQIAKEPGCQGLGFCQCCLRIRLPFVAYNYAIEKNIHIPDKWKIYKSASPNWLNKFMIRHEQIIKELFSINSCQSAKHGRKSKKSS